MTYVHPSVVYYIELAIIQLIGRGRLLEPTSISEPITDRGMKYFSGSSCALIEKITFSSHDRHTAPMCYILSLLFIQKALSPKNY